MSKYFGTPFAESGNKSTIPDAAQAGGEVSYAEGFTDDYELDQTTNPNAKDIRNFEFNQFGNDVTGALKDIQEQGIRFYTGDVNYPVNARVIGGDGNIYKCLIPNGASTTVVDPVGDVTGTWVADGGIGVNQTRINYSSSGRTLGVTYTNSTGKPRFVDVTLQDVNAGNNATVIVTINGSIHNRIDANATLSATASKSFIVLDGESYSINGDTAENILYWWELN